MIERGGQTALRPVREAPVRDVYICGNFDVFNFGDVLFPLVARRRLEPYGYRTIPVAPTSRTAWPDSIPAISLDEMFASDGGRGVLVGGGHVISDLSVAEAFPTFDHADPRDSLFPGLWLGATLFASVTDTPVAWNAPGVMRPFVRREIRTLCSAALGVAQWAAVRDAESLRQLGAQAKGAVSISPDTVIELSTLWPRESLAPEFRAIVERSGFPGGSRFFSVQIRRMLLNAEFSQIAEQVSSFSARTGLIPILIGIGPSIRDDFAARRTAEHLTCPYILLDQPASVREIAAAIAHSEAFIGQSLHGCVAAASYGIPAAIVARRPARRLAGFLAYRGTPELLFEDWPNAFAALALLPNEAPLPRHMLESLEHHWQQIIAMLEAPRDKSRERLAFLQTFARLGARALGTNWAFKPLLPATYQSATDRA